MMAIKNKSAGLRGVKCCKYWVIFYLILNLISGLAIGIYASYLLLFHRDSHISKSKQLVLFSFIVPSLRIILSSALGGLAVKRENSGLLKTFAVVLAVTVIFEIVGCVWTFVALPKINEQLHTHMEEKFAGETSGVTDQSWINSVETRLKCCGLHGITDYHKSKFVPLSCCGSDSEDTSKGSCSFLWQRGCSSALSEEVLRDLITLDLLALSIALLQIPGIFVVWCFANRLSKESI